MAFDVSTEEFDEKVVGRSSEVPVVVDFWAEWCGPCRQLTPALERAEAARNGQVELAKVDVDSNQALAAGFGVQGIPAVKAFRDGKVVDEFVGAVPPARVEEFFDRLVGSEAQDGTLEEARKLIASGDTDKARKLLTPLEHEYVPSGLLARLELDDLDEAFGAWDAGEHAAALEALQDELAAAEDNERRDLIRRVMVAIFTELGPGDPLASEHRRRLATALN